MSETTESNETSQDFAQIEPPPRLPWETGEEHKRFMSFLQCPGKRSIRAAYRFHCELNGITPKKDPPPSWFELAKGQTAAITKAQKQLEAIERAGEMHERFPDWEGIEAAILSSGQFTEEHPLMFELNQIEWAFWSIAIDLSGNPIPGAATWEQRRDAYQQSKSEEKNGD